MPEKKEQNKFTIQFNPADPTHQQVIDILTRQGRRKAQFLVSAVQHYLHCPEIPDIPQPVPVDIRMIEVIVRRILEEQDKPASVSQEPATKQPRQTVSKAEGIHYDEAEELLGAEGLAAIASTMAAFRKN